MLPIQIKAIKYALIVFIVLFIGIEVQRRFVHPFTGQDLLVLWLNLSAFLLFIVPGYIAASFAGKWGTAYGFITGLAAMVLATAYYSLLYRHFFTEFETDWYMSFAFGAVCGSVGGLIWDVKTMVVRFRAKYTQN